MKEACQVTQNRRPVPFMELSAGDQGLYRRPSCFFHRPRQSHGLVMGARRNPFAEVQSSGHPLSKSQNNGSTVSVSSFFVDSPGSLNLVFRPLP